MYCTYRICILWFNIHNAFVSAYIGGGIPYKNFLEGNMDLIINRPFN